MIQSMVDYVLQPINHAIHKHKSHAHSNLLDHRKLLEHLFQDAESSSRQMGSQRRISDMKYEEISTQLSYFSEKIHGELSKKFLDIDNDLYRLENEWIGKKMPDFYCYYFLKFSYANAYSRMQELFSSEIENMGREKDSYSIIQKTIEAREICLSNLRKEISTLTITDIEESLTSIKEEQTIKKRKIVENEQKGYRKKTVTDEDEMGKNWKNKLEVVFELISHLRKLTVYVIELIKNWRNSIYGISEDPRKYRERVIFYHNDANYLLKMTFDNKFVFDSLLNKFITFANHYDPFFLKPCMIYENNKKKASFEQEIFYEFLKPTEIEMEKITRALVVLAEEEYDENEQTKLIYEKEKIGELDQRKQYIERKRDSLNMRSKSSSNPQIQISPSKKRNLAEERQTKLEFVNDKQSDNTELESISNQKERETQLRKTKLASSMNRIKQIKSVDLKKVSPYLNRNERIAQAQKVLELEHQFRLAQNEYADSVRKERHETKKAESNSKNKWNTSDKDIANNKAFTKYIEANLKLNEEANKKAFMYKNSIAPNQRKSVNNVIDYNKIPFKDRKELEYEKNLESYQRVEKSMSQTIKKTNEIMNKSIKTLTSKGTKAVIEISENGIKNKESVIDYELLNKRNKNVASILQNSEKQEEMKQIEAKLNSTLKKDSPKKVSTTQHDDLIRASNLFETEQKQEIIVLRQEPEKIEEIKQFLYAKIKEELMEEMKKTSNDKETELSELIEDEKRKKLQEIMKEQTDEENRKKEEQFKKIQAQMDIERKKIDLPVKVESIQYSEENLANYFDTIFDIFPQTYHRMFLNESVEEKKNVLTNEFYIMFLKGFLEGEEVANAIVKYDWAFENSRKLKIEYVVVNASHYFMSSFHQFCSYIWQNDPADYIELVVYNHLDNEGDKKILDDLEEYCQKRAETFEKSLYSNIKEIKFVQSRPKQFADLYFPKSNFCFSKLVNLKCELLSSAMNLNEKIAPKMDMNLETFTNYIFLLEELFRKYLTPEEVVELRENSNNIRRLKDIFRIVLELETSNPVVDELKVIEGLNLEDLYEKLKEKVKHPYNKYYWPNFYDRTMENRLLLSILEFKLELEYSSNSCELDNKKYMKINPHEKVLTLRSSIYSKELIYILKTKNPKIKMFIMDAEYYKLMRIELFVFLNLVFNNIVEDNQIFVNSFWIPQFVISNQGEKEVKRITDFSISMKKNFYLSEEIYFANYEYIRNGISFVPKKTDVIYNKSVIMGFLHTDIESGSTGMPIYAKMIDQAEIFAHEN